MRILIINAGSSSLKYQLIAMTHEHVLAKGVCDRIGLPNSFIRHEYKKNPPIKMDYSLPNHKEAISKVIDILTDPHIGVISNVSEIHAVGHRVVHGGEHFSEPVIIDQSVIRAIRECIPLAVLHNPANIIGIEACKYVMPHTPMVAAFDTSFHQSMPPKAFTYGVPHEFYENYGIRKYGFHGTSHEYVAQRAAHMLKKNLSDLKIVSCHLGNGASICAIENGKSVDTSMGFTPLSGLVMGTRCGNIDPSIPLFLMEKEKIPLEKMNEYLNKKSGILGISGISSDMRDVEDASAKGNYKASLALSVFCYTVKKHIGEYSAVMGGIDVLIFTAGIGENDSLIRSKIVHNMGYLGIKIDSTKNKYPKKEIDISADDAKVRTLVIPTNEELAIARSTMKLVRHHSSKKIPESAVL